MKPEVFTDIAKHYTSHLEDEYMICTVSQFYDSLGFIADMKWQTDKLLEIGPALYPGKSIFFFDDFVLEVVLDAIIKNIPVNMLKSAALERVKSYDQENGTKYYETIMTLYLTSMNKKETAMRLCIHPNTVKYRLENVKRLFGIDLASDRLTQMQLAIEGHLEKTKGSTAPPGRQLSDRGS